MRLVIAFISTLMLLILVVNANEKLDLKKDASLNNETWKHYAESLIKSDSENSAKPELGILQKPILLKDEAKSKTQENPMKHMKPLPESKNVSKHDSPRHKVMSANDNTYNEAVSPSLLPLQNDSRLAHDNSLNSTTVHTSGSTKNVTNHPVSDVKPKKTNENTSLNVPPAQPSSIKNNNSTIPETHVENSTISNEQTSILPFDIDEVTNVVTSMLFGNTESGITNAYPEKILDVVVIEDENIGGLDGITEANTEGVLGVVVIKDENIDGLDLITDTNTEDVLGIVVIEDETESNTGLFIDTLGEEPLIEAITLETIDLEITTIPENHSSWPIEKFDFLVFDENSSTPCILLTMNISLSISYEMKDYKINTTEYQLPNEVIVSGHCGNQNSFMTISWVDTFLITKQNSITFNFVKDNSSFYADSVNINIALDSHNFPNAKDAFISGNSSTNLKLFSAPVQNGIHICPTMTKISCGKIVANINNVAVFAFNKNQELTNRKEEYCHITPNTIEEVNVGGIVGGIIGVVMVLAVVATLCSWYRRRTDIKLRSELP